MDWENERYVRVYTRDTIDWVALGWEAQALFLMLIRKVDRSGVLEVGKHGARGIAGLIGMPADLVERALAVLVNDGCVTICDGCLLIPNFIEAQEAKQSDKQRQKECRDKRRKGAMSRPATEPSRIVTEGHRLSQAVTDGHNLSLQPSLASQSTQPSQPEFPARDPGTTDTTPLVPVEPEGPLMPDTPDRLKCCLDAAMQKRRPERCPYSPGQWWDREAGQLLRDLGDPVKVAPEVLRRIGLFVADDRMAPWTVKRFCSEYNGIGVARPTNGNGNRPQPKAVTWPALGK